MCRASANVDAGPVLFLVQYLCGRNLVWLDVFEHTLGDGLSHESVKFNTLVERGCSQG